MTVSTPIWTPSAVSWRPSDRISDMVRTIVFVGLIAVALIAFLWIFQRQLIYLPSDQMPSPPPAVEEVSFATEDDLDLSAWFVRPSSEPLATVIVFNGNAGNRSNRLPLGMALADEGFAVLLVDYRGYGRNPGSPSESGFVADAKAAAGYLESRDGVDDDRIVYFGESLGAAVATALATERPPAALVLRSPFSSLAQVARVHYPWLPVSLLLRDRYPVQSQITRIDSPVMIILGTDDHIVPPDLSRVVFDAAPEPKSLVTIQGAGHNDMELLAGDEMIERVSDFLRSNLP